MLPATSIFWQRVSRSGVTDLRGYAEASLLAMFLRPMF